MITDVLDMTVLQALDFSRKRNQAAAGGFARCGPALSDPRTAAKHSVRGESQRIKLASESHKQGKIYVMDEPTTGLHMSDVGHLLDMMNRLVDNGDSVIVIEHNLDVIRQADWIIDLGPEGGEGRQGHVRRNACGTDHGGTIADCEVCTGLAGIQGSKGRSLPESDQTHAVCCMGAGRNSLFVVS